MAITWTFSITPINVSEKIVSVTAVAHDDTPGVDDIQVRSANADISSPAKKTESLNVLWAKYIKITEERIISDNLAEEIELLQTSAKANFEGRSL